MSKKQKNQFPENWDEAKVKDIIEHYEGQSDEEAAAEIESAHASDETLMLVPKGLVAKIQKIIADYKKVG